jgi:hypothetical protein
VSSEYPQRTTMPNSPTVDPIHASVGFICARHGCSRSHLYALLGEKKIIARKNGPRILVNVPSADAYFETLPPAEIKPRKPKKVAQ